MLTRRIPKASSKISDNLQGSKQSESIENIVKNTTTNNDDELVKKVTMITEEHLSSLVPIIADLMSYVSNKVNYIIISKLSLASKIRFNKFS